MSDGVIWDNVNVVGSWFCGSTNQVIVSDHVTTMVVYPSNQIVVPNETGWKDLKFGGRGLVMVETKDAQFLADQGWLEQFEFKTAFASGRLWRLTPAGLKRFCDQPEPTS